MGLEGSKGGGLPFGRRLKKGARLCRGLCRRVMSPQGKRLTTFCASLRSFKMCSLCIAFAQGAGRKVLRIDQPLAGRFLSLTGPLAPRVVVSPSWAMSIKSALRDLLSVSYGIVSTTVISHLRWLFPPFGALRHHLPPAERWDNKDPHGISNSPLNQPGRRSRSQAEPIGQCAAHDR